MTMDFDQLAIETFTLKNPFEGKSPFDVHQFDELPVSLLAESEEDVAEAFWTDPQDEVQSLRAWLFPESPGILYFLDKNGPTFCLRGQAVANIKNSLENLRVQPELLGQLFRTEVVNEQEFLDEKLWFFETESEAMAEVIIDQLFNRRFPIEEDMLCNLSDPGFSWWLKSTTQTMNLYFRSHGVNRAQELLCLGPIGDRKIAALRFEQLKPLLHEKLQCRTFQCSDKGLNLEVRPDGLPYFQEWLDFLCKGAVPERLLERLAHEPQKTLFYYVKELAGLRQFWIEIQGLLESEFSST